MTTHAVRLDPLDVLFFRDGRPFNASSRASTGLPTPQIIAGALRTALMAKYGCDFTKVPRESDFSAVVAAVLPGQKWIADVRFRGPWFCRGDGDEPDVLVPAPATLHEGKKGEGDGVHRLRPLRDGALPGWKREENHGLRPLWLASRGPTAPVDGYLTLAGLRTFLAGGDFDAKEHIVRRQELFEFDYRTGIGVEPDRLTAAESMIYGVSFLAPKWKDVRVGLYAEVELPEGAPSDAIVGLDVISLGGEGRRVKVDVLKKPFVWPDEKPSAGYKAFVLLTTPALSDEGWKPAGLPALAAAAVPTPLAVSGWDLAKGGPKPTRFAAPAGSVYFLDGPGDDLPPSLADDRDAPLGWGCYLKEAWIDDR